MISAFGVEHGDISKSKTGFIARAAGEVGDSNAWKPIMRMTKDEKKSIRRGVAFARKQRVNIPGIKEPGIKPRNNVAFGGRRNITKPEYKKMDSDYRTKRRFQGMTDDLSKGGSIAPLARSMKTGVKAFAGPPKAKPGVLNRVVGNPMKPGKVQGLKNRVGASTLQHTNKIMGAIDDKLGMNPLLQKRR